MQNFLSDFKQIRVFYPRFSYRMFCQGFCTFKRHFPHVALTHNHNDCILLVCGQVFVTRPECGGRWNWSDRSRWWLYDMRRMPFLPGLLLVPLVLVGIVICVRTLSSFVVLPYRRNLAQILWTSMSSVSRRRKRIGWFYACAWACLWCLRFGTDALKGAL